MIKKITFVLLSLCFIIVTISAQQVELQKTPSVVFVRPDIVVEKIRISSLPSQKPGKVFLKIEYWLSNKSSKRISCCPTEAGKKAWKDSPSTNNLFNVRVDARSYPNGRFSKIGGTTTDLEPFETNDRYQLYKYFSVGQTVQIRVIADPKNWINEKNEKNNVKKMVWPLRVRKTFKK